MAWILNRSYAIRGKRIVDASNWKSLCKVNWICRVSDLSIAR
jgi:hypothetical protein